MNIRGSVQVKPLAPDSVLYSSTTTNPNNTPWLTWNTGTDLSKTGLNSYEISIGSTLCGNDIYDWTNTTSYLGSSEASLAYRYGSFYLSTPLVEGTDYYFNIRSKDNLNQLSDPVCKKFNYTSTGWKQENYFKAANSDADDQYGYTVAAEGDTLVVGAPQESSSDISIINGTSTSSDNTASRAGAVYVYRRTAGVWQQEAYIKAPNADAYDLFGFRVAISGDTIAVSAPYEASNQTTITNGTSASSDNSVLQAGAVYIFKRTGSAWAQEAYIKSFNGKAEDRFGIGLALNGDTLAVGAIGEDTTASDSGAVYVYKRTGSSWAQESYIKAVNANSGYLFGGVLTLKDDTLAISSTDEASSQKTITNGATASSDKSTYNSGAVYVYRRSGVSWTQEAYIKASNADANDQFGMSISYAGDTLAVGAAKESSSLSTITNGPLASSDNSYPEAGAVYIYKRTGSNWAQEAFIKPPNPLPYSKFGITLSLNDNRLAVGAPNEFSAANAIANDAVVINDDRSPRSGATYVFERSGSSWSMKTYIKALNSYPELNFGAQVSLTSTSLFVGTPTESTSGTTSYSGHGANAYDSNNLKSNSGAVYVYSP